MYLYQASTPIAQLLADLAGEAESAGWNGFFLQDTLSGDVPTVDPWLALAVVAARTERILLGVLLTALARRRLWLVARQATTIDHLSGGRLVFGAALGYNEQDFGPFGDTFDPRAPCPDARRESRRDHRIVDRATRQLRRGALPPQRRAVAARARAAATDPGMGRRGWPNRAPMRRAARWDGVYLMTVRQDTHEHLSPDDVPLPCRTYGSTATRGCRSTSPSTRRGCT